MQIYDIARVLDELGNLLELTEDNPFRARAFYQGSQVLRENAQSLQAGGDFTKLPGIGESLAKVISELQTTGQSDYYNEVKSRISPELRKLLHIPGLGAKTIRVILKEAQVKSMADLENALAKREIRKIKGLSSKTEGNLKRGLELLQERPSYFLLGVALPLGKELVGYLGKLPGVVEVGIVGSTARGRETVRDLDLVVGCRDEGVVIQAFGAHAKIEKLEQREGNKLRGITWFGLPVDLYLVAPEEYRDTFEHLSGDFGHHAKLRQLGLTKGFEWDHIPTGAYQVLGLPDLPAELREEEAELTLPPNLLQLADMKGDLHMHTRWSDGGNSIKEMALAGAQRGYEYIAVCDHSQNLAIAKGLKPAQLLDQRREIDQVNQEIEG